MQSGPRRVTAPRGAQMSCKGWIQEAALRMLMNNLDPEVAEDPDRLVVYGGNGKAARSWPAFDAIVNALRKLENDETLLVQSGKPVGVITTHELAPRVLIANSLLVPKWATWEEFRRLEQMGLTELVKRDIVPDVLTDQTSAHDTLNGYVPLAKPGEDLDALRCNDPKQYVERARETIGIHVRAMLELQRRGAITFDYGNNIRAEAVAAGVADAFHIRGFVPEYIRPQLCVGRGPFRRG